ncbi:TFIIA-domain-containing protein [Ceraceosorus guamensis]|uniref:Transcription initiation factor IIA large subunit n=1 Tax=Ceraceosorus guamensis TaxID=1522189 RepID=A0A316W027_9BASI|nr:TFIIA-domain-containing protein [Ceraceosorus guamensis]PWN41085.1 TFIIA-domain-containing protein [Ceraceosorus guamensis]
MSNRAVSATYRQIIDDVIANVRQDFEDVGVEKEVLEELQRSWEAKILATGVAEFDGAPSSSAGKGGSKKGGKADKDKEVKPNVKNPPASGHSSQHPDMKSEDNGQASSSDSRKMHKTEDGKAKRDFGDGHDDGSINGNGKEKAGEKRKRAAQTDEINSDLDDSDDEEKDVGEIEGEDMILCLYDKVQRVKNKWKCVLKDGIANIDGRDYVFSKLNSDFEW